MPKRLFIKDGGLTSSIPTPTGYTVIGSDNGTPKKQVQSTISDLGSIYTQTIVNISSSEILNMGTTPIQLLPQPGVGKYYDVDKMIFEFTFGTQNYNSPNLVINDGGVTWAFIYSQFVLLGGSENSFTIIERPRDYNSTDFFVTGYNQLLDKGYYLTTYDNSNPTDGDGTLRVIIYSKIRTFGAI